MRVKKHETLEHYLQQVISRQVVARLSGEGRARVKLLMDLYEPLLRWIVLRLRENNWAPLYHSLRGFG